MIKKYRRKGCRSFDAPVECERLSAAANEETPTAKSAVVATRWTANNTWSADMIAATAGNGLVVRDGNQVARLDSSGSATYDTWTASNVQYASGNRWVGQGSADLMFAPGLLWANSSFPEAAQGRLSRAYHHYDFELLFCNANLCSPDQDVAFVYYQDNPHKETEPTTNLTQGQIQTIRAEAFKAFKGAFAAKDTFAGYPVRIYVGLYGAPTAGHRQIQVTGDIPSLIEGSVPCGTTSQRGYSTVSLDYYLSHMEQAQWASDLQSSTPTDEVVRAIGKGIGNTAAHEAGHQIGLGDYTATGVYEGGSCDGSIDPSPYTGESTGGTPIHWGDTAKQILKGKIYAP